jgi:hypothetical protein
MYNPGKQLRATVVHTQDVAHSGAREVDIMGN